MLSCAVRVRSSVIAALLLTASGCGSSGGGPSGGSGGPWLLYAGVGVFALDASNPSAAVVTVDATSNVGGLRVVPRGTYAAATGAISALEAYGGIWISGGRILRASTLAGSTLATSQVSTETNVGDPSPLNPTPTHLCDTEVVIDWSTPGDSRFLYTLAGPDLQCGTSDDVVKVTRLEAAATDAPVTVPGRRVSVVRAPSTGAITGWLVIDASGRLVRTDAAFANPVQLLATAGFAFAVATTPSQVLLLIQSGSTVAVQRFDPNAGTLDATALFTLPGGIASSVAGRSQDASSVYMIVFDGSNGAYSLWRLALGATQTNSAIQMTLETGRRVLSNVWLTTNKVVFVATASGTDSLVAADKSASGTAPAPALGAASAAGSSLSVVGTAADKVFVNVVSSGGRTARAVNEAGTDAITQANAEWVGFAGDNTTLLATGLSAAGSYSGASLSTVVATTGAAGIQLGAFPADIQSVSRSRWAGSKGLLRGFTRDANGGMFGEILFADASTASSLLRVTNTPTISETLP
jgi:hypothetical protein